MIFLLSYLVSLAMYLRDITIENRSVMLSFFDRAASRWVLNNLGTEYTYV